MKEALMNKPFSQSKLGLDVHRNSQDVRIEPENIYCFGKLENQFIERTRSILYVWQYLKHVGFLSVLRKIRSRLSESERNKKYLWGGIGIVLEPSNEGRFRVGDRVVFFATNHSRIVPTVCIDSNFVSHLCVDWESGEGENLTDSLPSELRIYEGWSPYSGITFNLALIEVGLRKLQIILNKFGEPISNKDLTKVSEIRYPSGEVSSNQAKGKLESVIFGYGNYAKTQVLPVVRKYFEIKCIHEVDPEQLLGLFSSSIILDTSPSPRSEERYGAWFITGFHHTHAEIAVRAMETGGVAVVEKPIVTNWIQYRLLRKCIEERQLSLPFFACFQKRYSPFNKWIYGDLGLRLGDPIDLNCLVYEIPLPRHHWYNWPNSGSRIVSNGCHWLDQFMFLNNYARVVDAGIVSVKDHSLTIFTNLENGANFVINLTERGSQRLGVREVLEARSKEGTVRITDASCYEAENSSRILRRKRINPLLGHSCMYEEISRKIIEGAPGDSIASLGSTELMLLLEDQYQDYCKRRS